MTISYFKEEIELGLEIEAIKSEIPLQYRHKYFK